MNKQFGLRERVSFASVAGILIFGLTVGSYSIYKERSYRISAVQSEIIKTASFFAHQAYMLLKREDPSSYLHANQVVYENVSRGNFCFVEIVDAAGNLKVPYDPLGSGFRKAHGRAIQNHSWKGIAVGQDALLRDEVYEDVGPVIEGIFRIVDKDRILGYVLLGVSQQSIRETFRKSLLGTLGFLFLVLAVSIGFTWRWSRALTRPVLELTKGIENLKEGDPLDALNVGGVREVEILSRVFRDFVFKTRALEQKMQTIIQRKTASLEKSKNEMKAIIDLSNRLTRVLNLEEVLLELVQTAKQIVYCNEAYFFLNRDNFPRTPKSNFSVQSEIVSKEFLRRVLRRGEYELVQDTKLSLYQNMFHPCARSAAFFPLISSSGKPLGILVLLITGETKFNEDEIGRLKAGIKTAAVILENVLLYCEKEKLSRVDSMTGLLNRQHMMDALHRQFAIAQRRGSFGYLMLADLDHFKSINDTYGHLIGDRVIQAFAKIISSSRRAAEEVGRFGGEEFLILLPDTDFSAAQRVADKIMEEVRQCQVALEDGDTLRFKVSMGVAPYPQEGVTVSGVLHRADQALYRAKAMGKDQTIFWDKSFSSLLNPFFK